MLGNFISDSFRQLVLGRIVTAGSTVDCSYHETIYVSCLAAYIILHSVLLLELGQNHPARTTPMARTLHWTKYPVLIQCENMVYR